MFQIRKRLSAIFNSIDNKILDGMVAVNNAGHNLQAYIKKNDPNGNGRALVVGGIAGKVASLSLVCAFAAVTGLTVTSLIVALPVTLAGGAGGALTAKHYHKKLQQRKAALNP